MKQVIVAIALAFLGHVSADHGGSSYASASASAGSYGYGGVSSGYYGGGYYKPRSYGGYRPRKCIPHKGYRRKYNDGDMNGGNGGDGDVMMGGGQNIPGVSSVEPGVSLVQCSRPGIVALTFDDGPNVLTPNILNILAQKDVKATFFVIGRNVQDATISQFVKTAFDAGHQIGTHSFDHSDLTTLDAAAVGQQFDTTNDIVRGIIGVTPAYTRFPFGAANDQVLAIAREKNLRVAGWNLDTKDFEVLNSAAILDAVRGPLGTSDVNQNSFVVLQHDFVQGSADALPQIIDEIRNRGYQLVTFADCVGETGSPYS